MYVPMERQAIINQFSLTKGQIGAIKDISDGLPVNSRYLVALREKHIVMPDYNVLTSAGRRILERLNLK